METLKMFCQENHQRLKINFQAQKVERQAQKINFQSQKKCRPRLEKKKKSRSSFIYTAAATSMIVR